MTGPDDLGRLLRWYPRAWRDRYGEEFLAYMQDSFGSEQPSLAVRRSIAMGGLRERARRSGFIGDSVPPSDRMRAGVLTVLVAWTATVVAGASFAKMSEHFDTALPHDAGAHHLPDVLYACIQAVAGGAALVVLAGAGLALPAFVRYLRSGGWSSVRGHVFRAAVGTLLSVGVTGALVGWAHHLSVWQRNGGSTAYGILFLVWAALGVATLVLWAVLAVVAAARVNWSRFLLAVEACLAVAVTLAVIGILATMSVWWALIAARAPTYLSGNSASPLNARLVATVVLMALAAATAIAGASRIARSVAEWRRS